MAAAPPPVIGWSASIVIAVPDATDEIARVAHEHASDTAFVVPACRGLDAVELRAPRGASSTTLFIMKIISRATCGRMTCSGFLRRDRNADHLASAAAHLDDGVRARSAEIGEGRIGAGVSSTSLLRRRSAMTVNRSWRLDTHFLRLWMILARPTLALRRRARSKASPE